jgi:hypothetical protein
MHLKSETGILLKFASSANVQLLESGGLIDSNEATRGARTLRATIRREPINDAHIRGLCDSCRCVH